MDMTRRDFTAMASAALTVPALGGLGQGAAAQTQTQTLGQGTAGDPTRRGEGETPRIMVVSAHPADFCSRSGGTLIKYVRAGCKVKVVWLSHGETNESQTLFQQRPGISLDEVRRIREKEAFACAKVIGAEAHMFGFGDNPIRMTPERVELLAKEMADFKPTIILTHWRNEVTYASHWITSQSVMPAAQLADGSWNIHFFEPNIGTATRVGFVPDHYVDITDVFEQKIAALKELPTQPNLVENYTSCNRWRGLESGRKYAEAFVRWAPKLVVANLLE